MAPGWEPAECLRLFGDLIQTSTVLLYICGFNRGEAGVVIYISVMVFISGSSDVNISPQCHAAVVTATVCFAKIPSLWTIVLMHISSVLSRSRREAFFFNTTSWLVQQSSKWERSKTLRNLKWLRKGIKCYIWELISNSKDDLICLCLDWHLQLKCSLT